MKDSSSRRHKSVQLVSAPRDQVVSPISRSGTYQPLGLLSIASYILAKKVTDTIEILDGEFFSVAEIKSRLTAEIVGISCTTPSYRNALLLAAAAKARGASVVLGGAHPTALGEAILQNRTEVDFVVRGDGEFALAKLLAGDSLSEIPNLVYRERGGVKANQVKSLDLRVITPIRRDLLPLEHYIARYSARPDSVADRRPAAIYTQKGCNWRQKSGGCIFCGRQDTGWRSRLPSSVWREVTDLNRTSGVNFIWDVSDSFVQCNKWVLDLAAARPSGIDVGFFVYARPNELDTTVVKALSSIGCMEVFVGMESGSDALLIAANKGTTTYDNEQAASLLASHGIRMFPCFVFGLPGETDETIEETIKHARHLARICEFSTVSASVFVPLPGSLAFNRLMKLYKKSENIPESDIMNLESLARLWIETFCSASWRSIHQGIHRILELCPSKSSFFNFANMDSH